MLNVVENLFKSSTMSSLCSILYFAIFHISHAYFIIESKLSQSLADKYCQIQCSSHLTSITNITDELAATSSLLSSSNPYNETGANTGWIGLSRSIDFSVGAYAYAWTDGSEVYPFSIYLCINYINQF